jgi:hypothetical protein
LSFGSSSRISLRRQSFAVSRPRRRPPGNIHNRSRLLLTNRTRPRFAATSFDDFAIVMPNRPNIESFTRIYKISHVKTGRHLTGGRRKWLTPRPQLEAAPAAALLTGLGAALDPASHPRLCESGAMLVLLRVRFSPSPANFHPLNSIAVENVEWSNPNTHPLIKARLP